MPQFISLRTQYLGATHTAPAQVSASAPRRRTLTQDWNYQLTPTENHQAAATAWRCGFAPPGARLLGPAPLTDTSYQWLIQLPEDPT